MQQHHSQATWAKLAASATAICITAASAQADICEATGDAFWDTHNCPTFGRQIFDGNSDALKAHPPADLRACLTGWHGSVIEMATPISVGPVVMGAFAPDIPHKLELGSRFDVEAWAGDAKSIFDAGKSVFQSWQRQREATVDEDFDVSREAGAVRNAAKGFYPHTFVVRDKCAMDGRIWIRHVNDDQEWGLAFLRAVEAFIREAY